MAKKIASFSQVRSLSLCKQPSPSAFFTLYVIIHFSIYQPVVMAAKETVASAHELSLEEGLRFERRIFHSLFALVSNGHECMLH